MTALILEFEHKFIFYKRGILRYAMRHAGMQLSAAQSGARRRQLLSLSLKLGWAEAKAELSALQQLQGLMPQGRSRPLRDPIDIGANTSANEASPTILAYRQLH